MQGNRITPEDANRRDITLSTTNSTTELSNSLSTTLYAPHGYTIHCIIVASINLKGDVSIVEGGLGLPFVKVRYTSRNNDLDQLFVMLESNSLKSHVGNEHQFGRAKLVEDRMKDWRGVADDEERA